MIFRVERRLPSKKDVAIALNIELSEFWLIDFNMFICLTLFHANT